MTIALTAAALGITIEQVLKIWIQSPQFRARIVETLFCNIDRLKRSKPPSSFKVKCNYHSQMESALLEKLHFFLRWDFSPTTFIELFL